MIRSRAEVLVILLTLTSCFSSGDTGGRIDPTLPVVKKSEYLMPEEFQRSGMISSSTYQVFVVVAARDSDEAKQRGGAMAREKAYNLLLQEPFIYRNISEFGRRKIRSLIDDEGKIVHVLQEKRDLFSLVLQITQPGLRHNLQMIR